MDTWVIIYLPGNVGITTLVYGPFASLADAITGMVSTGQPGSYMPCQIYGPATAPPMTGISPFPAASGAWIAITAGLSEFGNPALYGYGTFSTQAAAEAWAQTQDSPQDYSFGQVAPL